MATLLVITVLLPLLGGVALLLVPRLDYRRARWVAMGVALVTLAATLVLVVAFRPGSVSPQFAWARGGHYGVPWLDLPDGPGIRFALGLDGISLWLFALTSLLQITAICSSWESVTERAPAHYALLLALESGLLGLFASLDVVLFYIFFEFTLIPLFFLIGLYGGPQRRRASVVFFLYTLAGSLLTLLGVIALVVVHYNNSTPRVLTFSIPELTRGLATIDWASRWPEWNRADSWTSPQVLIFLLLFAGFAIKVPLFPFHTWLPLAHVEAPTAGSVILAGVLLKVGGYGFLRFNLGMTPLGADKAAQYYGPADLRLGSAIDVHGRRFFLHDCDAFTRQYYQVPLAAACMRCLCVHQLREVLSLGFAATMAGDRAHVTYRALCS